MIIYIEVYCLKCVTGGVYLINIQCVEIFRKWEYDIEYIGEKVIASVQESKTNASY